MTSPFHEDPNQTLEYSNIKYKWIPFLQTPCYGFSGPNACFSSTCKHSARKFSDSEKQSTKPKKSSKCNLKLSSTFYDSVNAYNAYRSSQLSHYETCEIIYEENDFMR